MQPPNNRRHNWRGATTHSVAVIASEGLAQVLSKAAELRICRNAGVVGATEHGDKCVFLVVGNLFTYPISNITSLARCNCGPINKLSTVWFFIVHRANITRRGKRVMSGDIIFNFKQDFHILRSRFDRLGGFDIVNDDYLISG